MPEPLPFIGEFADHFLTANGLRLHYTEWNPGGQHTLVLVHGINVQLHTWDPIAHDLAQGYRVICLDLRGHGDSDWAGDGYGVQSFTADIKALVDQLGIAPFDFVGHSLGSRIGLAYAGEYPETVRRLVLSDTGPEVPRQQAKQSQGFVGGVSAVRGFRDEDEALAYYERLHPEWQPIFRQLHVAYQLRRNWAGKLVFKADPELFWLTGSAALREVPFLWEMVGRITAPTLILWGQRSTYFDDEILGRMRELISETELARPDTGHYIPRENPSEFIRRVREFLAR
jgi:pimeloyl-ACP methyl ester carboxylesterase